MHRQGRKHRKKIHRRDHPHPAIRERRHRRIPAPFSPALHREVAFQLSLSSIAGLEEWKLTIQNADRKTVREFSGSTPPERILKWDGTDTAGKRLPDGPYYYSLATRYNSGNTRPPTRRRLFSTPLHGPFSSFLARALLSRRGRHETTYSPLPVGLGRFRDSALVDIDLFERRRALQVFQRTGRPGPRNKVGRTERNRDVVESAADYFIEMETTDTAGNQVKTRRLRLPIDVLVMVTERGLRIRISNIEFGFDSAGLTGRAFPYSAAWPTSSNVTGPTASVSKGIRTTSGKRNTT